MLRENMSVVLVKRSVLQDLMDMVDAQDVQVKKATNTIRKLHRPRTQPPGQCHPQRIYLNLRGADTEKSFLNQDGHNLLMHTFATRHSSFRSIASGKEDKTATGMRKTIARTAAANFRIVPLIWPLFHLSESSFARSRLRVRYFCSMSDKT